MKPTLLRRTHRLQQLAVAALAGLIAGCSSDNTDNRPSADPPPVAAVYDAVAQDPEPGPYRVAAQSYEFNRITVDDEVSGNQYESDLRGMAWYPETPDTQLPVVVLMHGRHQTCQTVILGLPVLGSTDDDCPDGLPLIETVPSYRGYDAAAADLASHGLLVLSVDLNDVNDNDNAAPTDRGMLARAQVALAHLDRLREINANGSADGVTSLAALHGHLDFQHVGLMGHSRGGVGAIKAAQENAKRAPDDRFGILALFGVAPDSSGLNIGAAAYEVPPDVGWATIHGYCDGDAKDFFGAWYFDRGRQRADLSAPRHQIIPMGANHNNYNSEWSGTDDWTLAGSGAMTDPQCGYAQFNANRDNASDQQNQLRFFMNGWFRWMLQQDTTVADYWHGRVAVPPLLCDADDTLCQARFPHTVWTPPAQRLAIFDWSSDDVLSTNALGGPIDGNGLELALCTPSDGGDDPPSGGDGCPADPTFSRIPQLAITWTGEATLSTRFTAQDLRTFDRISLRVGLDGADGANPEGSQNFDIVLEDQSGHQAKVTAGDWSDVLFVPPGGSAHRRTLLHGIYVPLAAFEDVALGKITAIELRFGQTAYGSLQISDLGFEQTD